MRPPVLPCVPLPRRLHDSDGEHLHEMSVDARGAISEIIWKIDNVELTTVGIDIGSSTSHLMFARVRLQRKTQALSSQFVVIDREILWRSPILLTPFLPDNSIDAAALGAFIASAYADAELTPDRIDSGAVILTGEAIRRNNAQAIAELFAADAGKFVCASAGHHLECILAAHGSGAVALSRTSQRTVLNIDVGGGTSKLAWIRHGTIVATCAIAVGGRLIAFDEAGRIVRFDEAAAIAARVAGVTLIPGEVPAPETLDGVVNALARALLEVATGAPAGALAQALLLTDEPAAPLVPDTVTFSGGVSEYLYGRETATFGDIAMELAGRIKAAVEAGRIPAPVRDTGQGIRATVIGASQFSVQVSGKTIHLPDNVALPIHNVPVIAPKLALDGGIEPGAVAQALTAALQAHDRARDTPVALALAWHGEPFYARLRSLAEGIARAFTGVPGNGALVLVVDGDVARTLGYILQAELGFARPLVAIDGIALRELDYVDIGRMIEPAHVVPVVIKSLLFETGQRYFRRRS